MFEIYDLEMNKLEFPRGVKPLDIIVSSVGKIRSTFESDGRDGIIDYGYRNDTRSVDISLWVEAKDTVDYRLLRNELFEFFTRHDKFYISEKHIPSRVLKVSVDSEIMLDRLTVFHAQVDLPCTVHGTPFWESKYTTLELHDTGYSATAEKYGLVDNIDDEKVKYRFKNDTQTIAVSGWNDGGISPSNGEVNDSNINNIYSNEITVAPGMVIAFEELSNHPNINFWRAFEYNGSTFIRVIQGSPGTNTVSFTATGNRIRFSTSVHPNMPVRAVNVGVDVSPQVGNRLTTTNFKVYNAGNVTVEPESMMLNIELKGATSSGNLSLKNITTGEEFKLNKDISNRNVKLEGINVTENGINVFRDTNRRFISLATGDNEIEITGATFDEIFFSFKYLYK